MKTILPAVLNPISRRKDRSVKLNFETRELTPTEVLSLMSLEGSEGWLMYQPNEYSSEEAQNALETSELGRAEVSIKSPSERLRSVIFVHYKQATEEGKYVGIFDTFYKEQLEKIIEGYKVKNLHE